MSDYSSLLKVPRNASPEDIRRAYRRLALKWHPDKNPGNKAEAQARFKNISEPYEVLSGEPRRRHYDLHGRRGQDTGHHADFARTQGANAYNTGGAVPYRESPDELYREFFGSPDAFQDFYRGMRDRQCGPTVLTGGFPAYQQNLGSTFRADFIDLENSLHPSLPAGCVSIHLSPSPARSALNDYYCQHEGPRNASPEEIRRVYRQLALRWHPDKNPGDDPHGRGGRDTGHHEDFARSRGANANTTGGAFPFAYRDPGELLRDFFGSSDTFRDLICGTNGGLFQENARAAAGSNTPKVSLGSTARASCSSLSTSKASSNGCTSHIRPLKIHNGEKESKGLPVASMDNRDAPRRAAPSNSLGQDKSRGSKMYLSSELTLKS
ncbi:hypothetical protein HPB50_013491 [Hyalomma asiaticum]|uniref:Uncharacterized protein n=1 Tax=Hyalomma asiaticum TaxID=266040 RepID=A0ACB7S901_HYAAI|nr:hypothetical protein HPB50_013491 [Hyalomma asiaticum]